MKISSMTFDPRSKLVAVLFASLLLMFHFPLIIEFSFVTLLLLLFILNKEMKKGFFLFFIYWVVYFISTWTLQYINHPILTVFSFVFLVLRRFSPTIMAASFAVSQTKNSQWIATLKKCHLPFSLIVPLSVLFRFFPTLIHDMKNIRNAMKFRGIAVHTWELFLHPFKTLEFIVVPILMSAENISLDLSASALTRGLGNDSPQSSIYEVKFRWYDYLLTLVIILLTIGGFLL